MLLSLLSVISFLISFLVVALIKQRFSQQLLDIPNERSSHSQPTPRGGGLGFVVAFALTSGLSYFLLPPSLPLIPLWLSLTPLIIIGLLDDRRGIPSSIRYLVQLSSASVAVTFFGAFPQSWLSDLGFGGKVLAIILTIIGLTAIINFYNFMDGLDGLVAGCTAVQLGFLTLYFQQPILWLLVAALGGFLLWNWSPAKIFMGDVGSTSLGAIVAMVLLNNQGNQSQAWSALTITLPLIGDAIYTLICRLIRKENIFQAHRSHLYQRLHKSGLSHPQVAIIYIGVTLLIAISINYLRILGAWLSLPLILGLIVLGEIYLNRKVSEHNLSVTRKE
ncbi:MAG: glycosyltransferase family 4 protein [Microcystis aeruginosa BS13-10]|nr:glycosyltransferase family 4 protein [Microcystis aeruginosa BS13-10]